MHVNDLYCCWYNSVQVTCKNIYIYLFIYLFKVQGSVTRKFYIQISNKMQHYTVYLFLENSSTYFGWYLHPSSGAHTTVFTAFGTCQTVTAACSYRGRVGTDRGRVGTASSSNSSTIAAGNSNGLTSNKRCKYSCVLLMMGGDTARNM